MVKYARKEFSWDEGQIRRTIEKDHKTVFHLTFSQENFSPRQKEQIGSLHCGVLNRQTLAELWLATKQAHRESLSESHPYYKGISEVIDIVRRGAEAPNGQAKKTNAIMASEPREGITAVEALEEFGDAASLANTSVCVKQAANSAIAKIKRRLCCS